MELNDRLHAPDVLTPGKRTFATHEIWSWVGPSVGLDIFEEINIIL
jgi:hypothetical protein